MGMNDKQMTVGHYWMRSPASFGHTSDNLVLVYEDYPYRSRKQDAPKVFWIRYSNTCAQMMSTLPDGTIFGNKIVSDLPIK